MVKYDNKVETLKILDKIIKTVKHEYGFEIYNYKDELHSFNGKPAVEYNDGTKIWYKEWYKKGKLHRLDGPAVEFIEDKCWYYEGKEIKCKSTEEFLKIINLKAFW